MRHRKSGVKLNMTTSHRNAMFRNMATSLFKYGRIKTTDVRARELRRWADHLITLAKRGDIHARRQVLSVLREKDVVHKLFKEAGQRYADANSGYTRLTKLGPRKGDAADLSLVELTGQPMAADETKPAKENSQPRRRSRLRADRGTIRGSGPLSAGGAAPSYSSSTTWALAPPKPNELTPALLGTGRPASSSTATQSAVRFTMKNGLLARSI